VGVVVIALAGAVWAVGRTGDRWPTLVPTLALVVTERSLDGHNPERLRTELEVRIRERSLNSLEASILIPRCISDLASDDDTYNAMNAMWDLFRLGRHSAPALQRALRSEDWQQRQLAADVLRDLTHPWWNDKHDRRDPPLKREEIATDAMFRVSIEALKFDDLPRTLRASPSRAAYSYINNACSAFEFLLHFPDRTCAMVEPGLSSGDMQERFLSAALVAACGRGALQERAIPILIEHLKDNNVDGDSHFAAWALGQAGPAAMPYLARALEDSDEQARRYAAAILKAFSSAEGVGLSAPTVFERSVARTVRQSEPDSSWFRDLEGR
jgi:hypothetical protein